MKTSSQYGFSLLEIMIVLTIVSILAAVAAPSLQTFLKNNRARAISDDFVMSLYRTRSEAVKRGADVTMCASNADQTNCDIAATDFSNGWVVITDYDSNGLLAGSSTLFDTTGDGTADSPEEILYASGELKGRIHIRATANVLALKNRLSYRSNGLPSIEGTFGLSYQISEDATDSDGTQLSRIAMTMTGRVRSCIGDIKKCPASS